MDMMIYQTGYGLLPKSVMKDPNLKIESKAIFAYLTTFAGNRDTAFPGRELICKDLGISKDRFYKYMNELKEKGYIEVSQVKDRDGKFAHNVYRLIPFPEIPDTVNPDTEIPCTENKDTKSNSNKNNNNKTNKEPRHKYGEYKNILLSDKDLERLHKDYGKPIIDEYITKMDEWIELNGKRYKNYNLALRKWLKNAGINPTKVEDNSSVNQFTNFIPDNVKNVVDDELERIKKLRG